MRGKAEIRNTKTKELGITPAYAGKSLHRLSKTGPL